MVLLPGLWIRTRNTCLLVTGFELVTTKADCYTIESVNVMEFVWVFGMAKETNMTSIATENSLKFPQIIE